MMQETHPKTFSVEEIELTPNPRSVKFILDQKVIEKGPAFNLSISSEP